jgi:HD-GYP domain-containing protein (c-di-GMP phosphodiesterase class II)
VNLTDFMPQEELGALLSRAARVSGASFGIRDSEGRLLAQSGGSAPGSAEHRVPLTHGRVTFAVLEATGSPASGEVTSWLSETIQERVRFRIETDGFARHVAENYEELSGLFEVIQHLPSLTGLDVVENCRGVLRAMGKVVEAEHTWFLIARESSDELTVLRKDGSGEIVHSACRLAATRRGPWEYTFQTGAAINAACLEDLPAGVELRGDLGVSLPLVCLALEADGQVYGILCFCGKRGSDFFTSTEVKLANTIAAHTASMLSNARLYEHARSLFLGAITALSNAIESKDEYTHGHVERVTEYAAAIAEQMGFDAGRVELVRISAMMHDLGKIGVPDQILLKEGTLTDQERELVQRHALVGPKILVGIRKLEPLVPWIRSHHERPDGTGYPYGLRGAEIPIEAQILAVADAFDAMTSDRSYRKAMSPEEAAERLLEGRGTQFFPEVVQAFLRTPGYRRLVERQK